MFSNKILLFKIGNIIDNFIDGVIAGFSIPQSGWDGYVGERFIPRDSYYIISTYSLIENFKRFNYGYYVNKIIHVFEVKYTDVDLNIYQDSNQTIFLRDSFEVELLRYYYNSDFRMFLSHHTGEFVNVDINNNNGYIVIESYDYRHEY